MSFPVLILCILILFLSGCNQSSDVDTQPQTSTQTPPLMDMGDDVDDIDKVTTGWTSKFQSDGSGNQIGDTNTGGLIPQDPILIYHVALDAGQTDDTIIGCNDALAPVQTEQILETWDYAGVLKLLQSVSPSKGLYNPRYGQTGVMITDIDERQDMLTIYLSGSLQIGGVCDIPRLQETIVNTYQGLTQIPVQVFLNGGKIGIMQ